MNKRAIQTEMPFYIMFILYLSCVAKANIIPVHEYSCRIADRDTSAFSYVGQMFKN